MTVQLPAPLPPAANSTWKSGGNKGSLKLLSVRAAYDSTSFFLAYWYPQIAVYDDIFGWTGWRMISVRSFITTWPISM